jgi:hypothetical protein
MSPVSTHAFLLKKYTCKLLLYVCVRKIAVKRGKLFGSVFFIFTIFLWQLAALQLHSAITAALNSLLSKKQKTPAHLGVKLKNSAPLIKLNALNHLNRASVGDRVSSFFLLLAALEHKSVAARAVMSQEDKLDPDRGVF